uniref:Hemoglobin subunit alpha-like n=1 Tax=Podarcis muralis TaxID=64176 RepID=A0A670JGC8_PODMU
MGLTEEDKQRVRAIWVPVSRHAEAVGVEVLTRLIAAHPTTKTYFHHLDLSPDSAQLKALGKKVVDALSCAVENLDDLPGALGKLSELHAFELRVSPSSFEVSRAPGLPLPSPSGGPGSCSLSLTLALSSLSHSALTTASW